MLTFFFFLNRIWFILSVFVFLFHRLTESFTLLAIEDVLMDAALVLGGDSTLRILFMKLVQVNHMFLNDESTFFFKLRF